MEFGIRVAADCMTPRTDLSYWRVQYISIVARKAYIDKQREYLQRCTESGIKVALVYDSDSLFGDFDDQFTPEWGNVPDDDRKVIDRFLYYDRELGSNVRHHIIGNEPDGTGPASWIMSAKQFIQLGKCAKAALPFRIIDSGGLCSGDPHYLEGYYAEYEETFYHGNLHPYLQRPTPTWPDPTWGFGYIGDLFAHYQDHLPNTIFICGEWGTESANVGEAIQAKYAYHMALAQRDLGVPISLYFCAGDYMVPTFGARYADWNRKQPLFDTLRSISLEIQGDVNVSRYAHSPGDHDVGPGILERARNEGATLTSCELYYPLLRLPEEPPEFSFVQAEIQGKGVVYRYCFDTGKVSRFMGD